MFWYYIKYNQTAFTFSSRINGETLLLNDPSPGVELSNRFFSEDAGACDYQNTTFIDIFKTEVTWSFLHVPSHRPW